jgi:ribose 5-phosphate isomerase B
MTMTVYFASDHAGFELKNSLIAYVRDELGFAVEDCGAHAFSEHDDYPDYIRIAAFKVAENPNDRAIILGGSGQGEAIVANRIPGVRAVVYYGETTRSQTDADGNVLDVVSSTRAHNDANVLALGARFLSIAEAQEAVKRWLDASFSGDQDHVRRIGKIDAA